MCAIDYAEISRHARRIVDANRAQAVAEQALAIAAGPSPDSADQSQSESTQPAPKKVKYTRSTKGCLACRKHKVKCDETLPTCLRCVAAQRNCDYMSGSTSGNTTTAPRVRRSQSNHIKGEDSSHPQEAGNHSGNPTTSNGAPSALPLVPTTISPSLMQGSNGSSNNLGVGMMTLPGHVSGAGMLEMLSGGSSFSQAGPSNWETSPISTVGAFSYDNVLGGDHTSPDMSFLNDLFAFTPAPTLPALETSPSQILPENFLATIPAPSTLNDPLPHFANFTKSRLLNRRTAKGGLPAPAIPREISPMTAPVHPRLTLIESILHASEFDDTLFEFGPSGRGTSYPNSSLHGGTDVLSNGFPSPSARTLFHHYCNVCARFLVTMGNIGPNPLVTLCTPNKLLNTSSAASAAIRMSMLSTSIAHFTYETADIVGAANLGRYWSTTKARLDAVGKKFKKAALSNIFLAETTETSPEHVDSILAACTFICIRDVISADPTWAENMEFVLKLAHKKGGPQAMLKDAGGTNNFTRRYLLENLATHDVFSCFTTGKEPALLGNYDCWWFESVETSQTRWEWESVERTFGISRAMVELVARVVTLDSRKRRLGIVMSDHPDEMMVIGQHFVRESHCLLLEADIWGNSLSALPQHHRVTCGDYIYKYMTVVIILADVLEQPISTPRIAKSVDSILELCSEATAMRMSVMLTWPLLIAGLYCLPEIREKVSSLFDAFQYDYCEDLRVARALLEEQWRLIDSNQGRKPWREVMRRLDKHAMLI